MKNGIPEQIKPKEYVVTVDCSGFVDNGSSIPLHYRYIEYASAKLSNVGVKSIKKFHMACGKYYTLKCEFIKNDEIECLMKLNGIVIERCITDELIWEALSVLSLPQINILGLTDLYNEHLEIRRDGLVDNHDDT